MLEHLKDINFDDKDLAIICMTILGLAAIFTFDVSALNVVTHLATGIAGMVTGKALNGNNIK